MFFLSLGLTNNIPNFFPFTIAPHESFRLILIILKKSNFALFFSDELRQFFNVWQFIHLIFWNSFRSFGLINKNFLFYKFNCFLISFSLNISCVNVYLFIFKTDYNISVVWVTGYTPYYSRCFYRLNNLIVLVNDN